MTRIFKMFSRKITKKASAKGTYQKWKLKIKIPFNETIQVIQKIDKLCESIREYTLSVYLYQREENYKKNYKTHLKH